MGMNFAPKLTKIFGTRNGKMQPSKKIFLLLGLLSIAQIFSAQSLLNQYTLVLDPGHGGQDPGAKGAFSEEKNVVLTISLRVGELVKEQLPWVKLVYTRTTDVFVPLNERSKIANDNKANLFVSIHANSSKNHAAKGTETFVMGLHKSEENLEVARKENAVVALEEGYKEKYEGYDPNSVESYIIFSLMQNAFLDQSLQVADILEQEFQRFSSRKSRGVKQAGFLVLWNTAMPSILIEVGFISNSDEEKYMNSPQGIEEISQAIYRAIKVYFEDLREKTESLTEKNGKQQAQKQQSQQTFQGIKFSIQLTASKSEVDLNKLEFREIGAVFSKQFDGFNKYYAGLFETYQEARNDIDRCKKIFPGAFIVAFEDGKPIPVDVAVKRKK